MKLYHHIMIIIVIITLIFFLYGVGYGAIPFLLASLYLGFLSIKEFQRLKNSKRW
ncbi:hypothetical protein QTL97_05645 [Sporosarcina thermotolerans]|uniref:Uncharacterized protein n=1 Tax=Sporosarcina thermotolerans TaxID=633404 RepID=A0AAW9A632_9BACL|nr:hypothetical protein [Sporosarcina thermotolerans]MDW0116409.1 hypothetical protein [Sporosarcina thermotolerans]WHT48363.1 hypothetical protein QNH10_00360 [Sporosarcina thermotolerans]